MSSQPPAEPARKHVNLMECTLRDASYAVDFKFTERDTAVLSGEANYVYKAKFPCEPQLGKRGLYSTLSTRGSAVSSRVLINFLAYADGARDLIGLSEVIKMPLSDCITTADVLLQHGLVARSPQPGV